VSGDVHGASVADRADRRYLFEVSLSARER
jgi:hypothetical protein